MLHSTMTMHAIARADSSRSVGAALFREAEVGPTDRGADCKREPSIVRAWRQPITYARFDVDVARNPCRQNSRGEFMCLILEILRSIRFVEFMIRIPVLTKSRGICQVRGVIDHS